MQHNINRLEIWPYFRWYAAVYALQGVLYETM